jgi:hypothetical protein
MEDPFSLCICIERIIQNGCGAKKKDKKEVFIGIGSHLIDNWLTLHF